MKLRNKFFLGAAVLTLVPVALTALSVGVSNYNSAREGLEKEATAKLEAVRENKREQIEAYIDSLAANIRTLAASTTVVDAYKGFAAAVPSYVKETGGEAQVEAYKRAVAQFAGGEFALEFSKKNPQNAPDMAATTNATDAITAALQYQYIAKNPAALGKKFELNAASDNSTYSKLHAQFHPSLTTAQQQLGYYDIFLVEPESKRIVYTVFKELDFGTRLDTGIAQKTKLAEVVASAWAAEKPGTVVLSDYAAYLPSYNDQAAFMATPIFDAGRKVGVLAVQVPIDRITAVMTSGKRWAESGLGKTGETYLVGPDKLMRTDSRFLLEDKAAFLQGAGATLNAEQRQIVERKTTTIGQLKVDSEGVRSALAGQTGVATYPDYRGEPVVGAYAPLKTLGLTWALISEIDAAELFGPAIEQRRLTILAAVVTAMGVLLLAAALIYFFARAFLRPVDQLQSTVQKLGAGDFSARSKLATRDELQDLGDALDKMLDERLESLAKAQAENERLNNSVIALLTTMAQLSQRDLTARAPVTEDIVGTVADSVNLLTDATATALLDVNQLAGQVQSASESVQQRTQAVAGAVKQEQESLGRMLTDLESAMRTLRGVAQLAEVSNQAASQTAATTRAAHEAVSNAASGMSSMREQIAEMEKRIKRLGERSQEISQIVALITAISERTHVLALNASMQAAAAGDAGRGFSVVAEEVQRLSDSVRQSTQQISGLVQNIQLETNDAITTVNRVIDQVVRGSETAARSGVQMEETQRTTAQLVQAVQRIAQAAQAQVQIAEQLRGRVSEISASTQRTAEQVVETNQSTQALNEAAVKLVQTASVFRLPERKAA
jgi:methyl-accepting chemotaxis protein